MKRVIICLVAGLALIAALSGCGKAEKTESDTSTQTTEKSLQGTEIPADTVIAPDSSKITDSAAATPSDSVGHSGH